MARVEAEGALLYGSDQEDEQELFSSANHNGALNGEVTLFKRSNDRSRSKAKTSPVPASSKRPLSNSFGNAVKKFSKSGKMYRSFLLYSAFLGLGLCIALPGPTLLDLEAKTKSTTDQMSYLFAGRSVGYLAGSLIGGVLFDRVNQMLLLGFSLLCTGATTLIFPWASTLVLAIVLIGFQGFSMGMLDTGGNALCVRLWGKSSAPYLQGLHFAFGVGAFLAPLIAEPFLSVAPAVNTAPSFPNVDTNGTLHEILSRRKRAPEVPFGNVNYDSLYQEANFPDDPTLQAKKSMEISMADITSSPVTAGTTRGPIVAMTPARVIRVSSTKPVVSTEATTSITTTITSTSAPFTTPPTSTSSTSTTSTTTTNTATISSSNNTSSSVLTTTISPSTSSAETTSTLSSQNTTAATGTTQKKKPSVNDGVFLPDQSQGNADGSTNEGQLKKDTIAKGTDVVVDKPAVPAAPLPVESPTSSSTTPTTSSVSVDTVNGTVINQTIAINESQPIFGFNSSGIESNMTGISDVATKMPSPVMPIVTVPSVIVVESTTTSTTTSTSTTTTTTNTTPTTSAATTPVGITNITPGPVVLPTGTSPSSAMTSPNTTASSTTSTTPPTTWTAKTTPSTTTLDPDLASILSVGGVSRVHVAYMIVSIILGVLSVAFLLAGLSERLRLPCSDRTALIESQSESGLYRAEPERALEPLTEMKPLDEEVQLRARADTSACPSGFHIQLMVLLFIFYLLYVGGEVSFGQFISAYAERAQHWSRQEAAYAASAFWGALALGRGIAIPLTRYIRPASMIAIDLTLLTVAMLGLLIGAQSFDSALWICSAIAGLGMSSIFASGFSWTERYIPITGKTSSVLIAGGAVGEIILPVLAGFFFVRSPQSLTYLMAALSLLLAVLFVLLQNLALNGQDGAYTYSRASKRLGYENNGAEDDDDNEMVEARRHEAVRLLPLGNGLLPSPSPPGNEATRRSGTGSSASGNSNSSKHLGESDAARTKAVLYDIFDENGVATGSKGERKTNTLATNGSAVLIGDDDDDEADENFYDAFPVQQQRDTKLAADDGEVLLMDRRNVPGSSSSGKAAAWNRADRKQKTDRDLFM